MATSGKDRMQALRDRKISRGLRNYRLWLTPAEWAKLQPHIAEIFKARAAPE